MNSNFLQVYESYLFLAYFVTGFAFEAFSNVAQWHKRTYCLGNFWSKHLSYGIPANIWNYYCLVQQKTIFLAKLRYFPWLPLQFWFSFLFIIAMSHSFQVLQDYKKAKIGFGTGHNIRASMVQATYQCPFLNFPVKV